MKASDFFANVLKQVKSNAPEILTALGVSGVVTTAYLAAKGAIKASGLIEYEKRIYSETGSTSFGLVPADQDTILTLKENIQLQWKCYLPAVISGAVTMGCIIGASKTNSRRTAAAVTAYSLTERAFAEYKEKVVEQIGKGKEQKIRDEIAQDKVNEFPPCAQEVIITSAGHILCCELLTHRYFRSDMETLRKAQNDINAKIVSSYYVPLDEFYELIHLPFTSNSNQFGWDSNKLMNLHFSHALSENNEPCLTFEYNYLKPLK